MSPLIQNTNFKTFSQILLFILKLETCLTKGGSDGSNEGRGGEARVKGLDLDEGRADERMERLDQTSRSVVKMKTTAADEACSAWRRIDIDAQREIWTCLQHQVASFEWNNGRRMFEP
ncbi:hypothetical protein Csa_019795 [Cucumis sativus]|uniref:Uncharacterized protein n=1 Tax=Cucumis sativus TaxID=3659 RepID=A0A0A0LTY5_CUCSA|nr:hypothetical protein Csa_019795 [Cucumis sativus]